MARGPSPAFSFENFPWSKWGKGAGLAALGAVVGYVGATVVPDVQREFPAFAPLIGAAASALANLIRKWLTSDPGDGGNSFL